MGPFKVLAGNWAREKSLQVSFEPGLGPSLALLGPSFLTRSPGSAFLPFLGRRGPLLKFGKSGRRPAQKGFEQG